MKPPKPLSCAQASKRVGRKEPTFYGDCLATKKEIRKMSRLARKIAGKQKYL